jgi:glutaredoxin-related protein
MRDPIQERIEREINEHSVVLFMKATPVFPQDEAGELAEFLTSRM